VARFPGVKTPENVLSEYETAIVVVEKVDLQDINTVLDYEFRLNVSQNKKGDDILTLYVCWRQWVEINSSPKSSSANRVCRIRFSLSR